MLTAGSEPEGELVQARLSQGDGEGVKANALASVVRRAARVPGPQGRGRV